MKAFGTIVNIAKQSSSITLSFPGIGSIVDSETDIEW